MIQCKKYIIPTTFSLMLSFTAWSEAPVVDDSERFAYSDGQQVAKAPAHPKYDEPLAKERHSRQYGQDDYAMNNSSSEEGPPLAQEENSGYELKDNGSLISKVQSLQKDLEDLRGQLEVQAHEIKLLKEQQLAFYKDLDSRIGTGNLKTGSLKAPDAGLIPKTSSVTPTAPQVARSTKLKSNSPPEAAIVVSRTNPADEQISYMAAYELVTSKRYDDAIAAMQLFVKKYPKGGYTSNAEYWLGELYLTNKNYANAIAHFQTVLNQFSSSSKVQASMLKLGYAYAALGDKSEATKYLVQVLRTYPDTPSAQLASSKLESIKAL